MRWFLKQDESNPGDLESKLPNYFLPRDDMEKSMKRLHFNYKTVRYKSILFRVKNRLN